MIEEKGAMDVQNNTDSLGEGMTADRAQNIKGTLNFHIYLSGCFRCVDDFNTDTDRPGD